MRSYSSARFTLVSASRGPRFPRRFDDEIVLKAYCIRPVVTRLSQYTDQRVPDGTTMPRFAAADVDRILAGRSGSFYVPYESANHKIGILSDCSRTELSVPGSAEDYMEPSYLITTCCDWIVPSAALLGFTNT